MALLGETEEGARLSGASALSLIVAEEKSPARALYAKCGFLERGRAAAGGHSSIRMVKAL
jgi:ribosomal protein S18 acetylase RimI-like enzyme